LALHFSKEFRTLPTCIRSEAPSLHLGFQIVGAVGLNGVAAFVVVGHGLANESGWALWKGWNMSLEPKDMALGLVNLVLSIAILVLLAEPPSELSQPPIIGLTLPHPEGARVVRMRLLIRSLRKF
jgi:hypothetical protein